MGFWEVAFIITTLVLTTITVVKIMKRERVLPRFLLFRRLNRRGNSVLDLRFTVAIIVERLSRHIGQSDLDRWYREQSSK